MCHRLERECQGGQLQQQWQHPNSAKSCMRPLHQPATANRRQVMRLIPRPSPANISVGDVVAFSSPLDIQGALPQAACHDPIVTNKD
jgi:hypothetical protein